MTARRRPRRPVSVPELQTWAKEVESTALKKPVVHVWSGGWCDQCGSIGVPEVTHVDRPRFLFEDIQEMDTSTLKEPERATPYLDPKHICAYDGPVKGCLCEETSDG
jgi:hypothetical protein